MRSWLSALVVLAACGTEYVPSPDPEPEPIVIEPGVCEKSFLDYDNFGAPFIANWCRGCHDSDVPANMRQKAPMTANFDTLEMVRSWAPRIAMKAASATPTMPPAGGPTREERDMLAEWIGCGVR